MFNIKSFPKRYVERRWSKVALPPNSDESANTIQSLSGKEDGSTAVIREIMYSVEYCVNRLVCDMDKLILYRDQQKELMLKADIDVPKPVKKNKNVMFQELLGVTEPVEPLTINVPTGIRNKGSGSRTRYKSKKEIAMTESGKNQRLCSRCKTRGHNIKTCALKNGASTSGK